LGEEFFEEGDGTGHAEILFVHHEASIAVVFLEDYDSSFFQGIFGANKELDSILVIEMRKDPLDPYAVVLFIELQLLKTPYHKVSNIFVLKGILCFFDQLSALVNNICLRSFLPTVLKTWQRSSLEIRPMPAPQSRTTYLLKRGLFLTSERRKPRENLISSELR
jgi:hypothetical protein